MKTILVCLCVSILSPFAFAAAATVLITGSDRGLGLEFVKQYAARGDFVIATCRHPDKAGRFEHGHASVGCGPQFPECERRGSVAGNCGHCHVS